MATVSLADGIELRLGRDDAAEQRDITPFVKRFVWVESMIRGGFFWEATVTANVWREWNDIILGRDDRPFQLRVTNQTNGVEASTEWRTAVVDSSDTMFRGQSIITTVRGGDRRLDMRQHVRHRAWPESTVSEIVRTLAADYDLRARVDETPNRYDRWQVGETDWDFLQRVVYGEATIGGRGDLFLWIDESEMQLRAPLLQAQSARRHDMDLVENRVDTITLGYMGRRVDRAGGATVQAVGFDFDTKQDITFEMGAAAAVTQPSLAGRVPRDPDGARVVLPVTKSSRGSVEGRARGRWGRFGPRYFSVRVNTRPDLALRPGQILEVQASLGRDQDTPFLGRFLVLEVQHALDYAGQQNRGDGGSIITSAICYRREAFQGEDEPSGASAENVRTRDNYIYGARQTPRVVVPAVELPG